jgi:hypothetical protein
MLTGPLGRPIFMLTAEGHDVSVPLGTSEYQNAMLVVSSGLIVNVRAGSFAAGSEKLALVDVAGTTFVGRAAPFAP